MNHLLALMLLMVGLAVLARPLMAVALPPLLNTEDELDPVIFEGATPTRAQRKTIELERGRVVRSVSGRLVIVLSITDATNGVYHEDAPFRAVSSMRMLRRGGDHRYDIDGYQLEVVRSNEQQTPSYILLPAIANGTKTIELDLTYSFAPQNLPFEDAFGLILPESGEDQLSMEVDVAKLFSVVPTAYTVTSVTFYPTQVESAEKDLRAAAVAMAAMSPLQKPLVRHLVARSVALEAGGASRQDVPKSHISAGGDIESCFFIHRTGATPVRADAHVTRAVWHYGRMDVQRVDYQVAVGRQKAVNRLVTLPEGVYYHQFDRSRLLRGALRMRGLTGVRWKLDTTAATAPTVDLITSEIYGQTPGR